MSTYTRDSGPIDRVRANHIPDAPDPVAAARSLLSTGRATLAAVAARWWRGDLEAAKAALYPPPARARR